MWRIQWVVPVHPVMLSWRPTTIILKNALVSIYNYYFNKTKHCLYNFYIIYLDIVDSSGMSFGYTATPRRFNAGTLFMGHDVRQTMIIPPGAEQFTIFGECSAECTEQLVCVYHILCEIAEKFYEFCKACSFQKHIYNFMMLIIF